MKRIITHNGIMHADEITAIALIKLFIDKEIKITRVSHETAGFEDYDFIIDIGRKLDGKKYFDHHQYRGGKSSAGLIWNLIGKEKEYPKISKLIDIVDKNDVGIEKAKDFEYSNLLRCFNTKEYLDTIQDEAFLEAVSFAYTILKSFKEVEDSAKKAEEIVKNSYMFDSKPHILELDEFNPFWNVYVNGEKTPHIKVVVWKDVDSTYKAKIAPKSQGSFKLNAKPFTQDKLASFVHSAGYFAVFQSEENLKKYMEKYYKRI